MQFERAIFIFSPLAYAWVEEGRKPRECWDMETVKAQEYYKSFFGDAKTRKGRKLKVGKEMSKQMLLDAEPEIEESEESMGWDMDW